MSNLYVKDVKEIVTNLTENGSEFGEIVKDYDEKTSLTANDLFIMIDSADSDECKTVKYSNIVSEIEGDLTPLGEQIKAAEAKTTPIDADLLVISDSADSDEAKKVTIAELKAILKTYFDTLYVAQ